MGARIDGADEQEGAVTAQGGVDGADERRELVVPRRGAVTFMASQPVGHTRVVVAGEVDLAGASDDQSVDAVGAGVVAAPQLHTVGGEAAEPDGILSVVVRAAGEAVRAVGADRVAAVGGCGNFERDGALSSAHTGGVSSRRWEGW